MSALFADRAEAGHRLGEALRWLRGRDVVVVGLPRGGVPVAAEVAAALRAPLDVIVVRKVGVPFQPELAMGAVGENGIRVINESVMRAAHLNQSDFAAIEARERARLARLASRVRGSRPSLSLNDRTVVVVDDGVATGSTMRAACEVVHAAGAAEVIAAIPVGPPNIGKRLSPVCDEIVCLLQPDDFHAVGQSYADFNEVDDGEVAALLAEHDRSAATYAAEPVQSDVVVDSEAVRLAGLLTVPVDAHGTVIFAHGSGSSRHSPRNRFVASVLNDAGFGTLLFDLLTPREESSRAAVFDIAQLGRRLLDVTTWTRSNVVPSGRIGYFGASTGVAAALRAAAEPDADIAAVVSRGGRPDLAGPWLGAVRAPTLLIVGERDPRVSELNHEAQRALRCPNRLSIVPGATHLFEEPGAIERVAALAREWFLYNLAKQA